MTATGAKSDRTLRVGSVPYLVGRPLDCELENEPGISLSRRVPAELVRGLRSGELDVALVSSIELFRRAGYRYLDGLAVSGEGSVASVRAGPRACPRWRRKPVGSGACRSPSAGDTSRRNAATTRERSSPAR